MDKLPTHRRGTPEAAPYTGIQKRFVPGVVISSKYNWMGPSKFSIAVLPTLANGTVPFEIICMAHKKPHLLCFSEIFSMDCMWCTAPRHAPAQNDTQRFPKTDVGCIDRVPASFMADLAAELNRDPAYRFEYRNVALAGGATASQYAAARLFDELFGGAKD